MFLEVLEVKNNTHSLVSDEGYYEDYLKKVINSDLCFKTEWDEDTDDIDTLHEILFSSIAKGTTIIFKVNSVPLYCSSEGD